MCIFLLRILVEFYSSSITTRQSSIKIGFALAVLSAPVIYQMQHDVVREGAVPRFGAALGVHGVLGVAELVEQVEGFDAGDELALEEGLADGGIQHEVVGVQFAAAIAATRVHVAVG